MYETPSRQLHGPRRCSSNGLVVLNQGSLGGGESEIRRRTWTERGRGLRGNARPVGRPDLLYREAANAENLGGGEEGDEMGWQS